MLTNNPSTPRAPVLFLVYNRPEVTAEVFAAIRSARPPRLYVAADGPRLGRDDEAERIAQTRAIATAVDWPCELRTLFRDENLGCKLAVSEAITWFFAHEESGIILEDDCLPAPSFFPYCETLLERYRDDLRIWHINGRNSLSDANLADEYYFSRYDSVWGWATWRRAWSEYDVLMSVWPIASREKWLEHLLSPEVSKYYKNLFSRTYQGDIDTWDYQWSFVRMINGVSIVPKVNLIQNLGFGADATHTTDPGNPMAKVSAGRIRFPLKHPTSFIVDRERDQAWEKLAFRRRSIRLALVRIREQLRAIVRRIARKTAPDY